MVRPPITSERLLAAAFCLIVAACGPALSPTPPGTSPGRPGSTAPAASPFASASPGASAVLSPEPLSPSPTASPAASASAALSPRVSPAPPTSAIPSPNAGAGPADACSGSPDNRDFFASLAGSVAWDVYCAVLPAHWNVTDGSYRLASGGRLGITYAGPGGAQITLREGAFCDALSPCPPAGTESGPAKFGARDAHLFVDGDGAATVFAQDGSTAWEMVGAGMDAATLTSFAAALARVGP